jgi:hypothetical protein
MINDKHLNGNDLAYQLESLFFLDRREKKAAKVG